MQEPKRVVKTGLKRFDYAFKGLTLGRINIVSGSLGMGKTSFLLRLAKHFHIENNWPVYWVSYSESHFSIAKRYYHLCQSNSQFNESLPDAHLDEFEHFKIDDRFNFDQLSTWVDQSIKENDQSLIIIENPDLFDVPYDFDKAQKVCSILKDTYKIIAGSQSILMLAFNSSIDAELRGGTKRTALYDLPYFDHYYRYIDKAFGLWRPEYYGFEQDEDGEPCNDLIYLSCLYNKSGNTAEIKLLHRGASTKANTKDPYPKDGLELKYKGQYMSFSEKGVSYVVKIVNESGDIILDHVDDTMESCWVEMLNHFGIEATTNEWLDFDLRSCDHSWIKFIIGKLLRVFESSGFETDVELKQKFDFWMNRLAY